MTTADCKTCNASDDERERIEAVGLRALNGEMSWRAAQRELGWPNAGPLKNHMTEHYLVSSVRKVDDELSGHIEDSVRELEAMWRTAPPEVKPLYLVLMQNMRE